MHGGVSSSLYHTTIPRDMAGRPPYPVIVSLAGTSPTEFGTMVPMFDGAAGYKMNLSCPNAAGICPGYGTGMVCGAGCRRCNEPAHIRDRLLHDAGAGPGADGITVINSIPGTAGCYAGGLSDQNPLPVSPGAVRETSQGHGVPAMGCGGVPPYNDTAKHVAAGTCAVRGVDIMIWATCAAASRSSRTL